MSRIHEALKKAEQERATHVVLEPMPPAPAPAPVAVATAPAAPTILTPVAAPAVLPARVEVPAISPAIFETTDMHLRYDEMVRRCTHPTWHPDPNVNVFFNSGLSPRGAEQFRTLRSRLYQLRNAQPLKIVLVTSSIPGEGKTFVANNLAQAIVRQPDRRALIIDADLRCSRLHVPLGAPPAPGLTDYLRGEADEMAVIQQGADANLCFIPGGNEVANPSELLHNGRLKKLLDRVAPVFDWVILDSPPCLPVADSVMLADYSDCVLLVVRAASTPMETAQRACQELQGKNVAGVVLNSVEESHLYGSYYYQGYGQNNISQSQGTTEGGPTSN
jgi:protein-tyrosine kinase